MVDTAIVQFVSLTLNNWCSKRCNDWLLISTSGSDTKFFCDTSLYSWNWYIRFMREALTSARGGCIGSSRPIYAVRAFYRDLDARSVQNLYPAIMPSTDIIWQLLANLPEPRRCIWQVGTYKPGPKPWFSYITGLDQKGGVMVVCDVIISTPYKFISESLLAMNLRCKKDRLIHPTASRMRWCVGSYQQYLYVRFWVSWGSKVEPFRYGWNGVYITTEPTYERLISVVHH